MTAYFRVVPPGVPDAISGYDEQQMVDYLFSRDERPGTTQEIGKSWAALDALLIAELGGPVSVILDGELVGPELDYGPMRYLGPEEVRDAAALLTALSGSRLLERYDAEALNAAKVYPQGWDETPETRAWLEESYEIVRQIFARGAREGAAVLLWLA